MRACGRRPALPLWDVPKCSAKRFQPLPARQCHLRAVQHQQAKAVPLDMLRMPRFELCAQHHQQVKPVRQRQQLAGLDKRLFAHRTQRCPIGVVTLAPLLLSRLGTLAPQGRFGPARQIRQQLQGQHQHVGKVLARMQCRTDAQPCQRDDRQRTTTHADPRSRSSLDQVLAIQHGRECLQVLLTKCFPCLTSMFIREHRTSPPGVVACDKTTSASEDSFMSRQA